MFHYGGIRRFLQSHFRVEEPGHIETGIRYSKPIEGGAEGRIFLQKRDRRAGTLSASIESSAWKTAWPRPIVCWNSLVISSTYAVLTDFAALRITSSTWLGLESMGT